MDPIRLLLPVILVLSFFAAAQSDVVITNLHTKIDLSSHIVRSVESLQVENTGPDAVSDILLFYSKHPTYLETSTKGSVPTQVVCPVKVVKFTCYCYSLTLDEELRKGESVSLEVKAVYTHILRPFPEKITQSDVQRVIFQDNAHYLSPYPVKIQSLTIDLPEPKVESYTKLENTNFSGSEINYGPYENIKPLSYVPIVVHYVHNYPFMVARDLVREIEVSHWGNVQVTENYDIVNAGAELAGEFSRLHFQARPHVRGAEARNLLVRLPPRAHSIYCRDEIGIISTSNVQADSQKTLLSIEPRYPMFGGWKTAFTIGYGLPLEDFLFCSEGRRFLNISFGCSMNDVLIENLTLKIVVPEGSNDISISIPFSVKRYEETKLSHLDLAGRPVIVLQKNNVVPEHNDNFQVYYRFNNLSLLREPLMLILGFFLFFVACVVYAHADLTISKSSASYLMKLQQDEFQGSMEQFRNVVSRCLDANDNLEESILYLMWKAVKRCEAAREAAIKLHQDLVKEFKPLLSFLQSSSQARPILPKMEELIAKEMEMHEMVKLKHFTVADAFLHGPGLEITKRARAVRPKIKLLRREVEELLEVICDFCQL